MGKDRHPDYTHGTMVDLRPGDVITSLSLV